MKTNEKINLRSDEERVNKQISLNANTQSDLQIDKTVPQNQENPKDSNGPCNLGPK